MKGDAECSREIRNVPPIQNNIDIVYVRSNAELFSNGRFNKGTLYNNMRKMLNNARTRLRHILFEQLPMPIVLSIAF